MSAETEPLDLDATLEHAKWIAGLDPEGNTVAAEYAAKVVKLVTLVQQMERSAQAMREVLAPIAAKVGGGREQWDDDAIAGMFSMRMARAAHRALETNRE